MTMSHPTKFAIFPLLLILALFTGCKSAPFRPEHASTPGLVVEVRRSMRAWGAGAVVGPRLVITTYHVLDGASRATVNGYPAKVVARATSTYEDILVLELDSSAPAFKASEIFAITPGARVFEVWSLNGQSPFSPSQIISGDSGSPVLTIDGTIVGLIYGRRHSEIIDWESNKYKIVPGQQTLMNRLRQDFKLPLR